MSNRRALMCTTGGGMVPLEDFTVIPPEYMYDISTLPEAGSYDFKFTDYYSNLTEHQFSIELIPDNAVIESINWKFTPLMNYGADVTSSGLLIMHDTTYCVGDLEVTVVDHSGITYTKLCSIIFNFDI